MWVDDVAAETERLVDAGWTLELAGKPPEEGYGSMTYVRSPSGFLLEPVSSAVGPAVRELVERRAVVVTEAQERNALDQLIEMFAAESAIKRTPTADEVAAVAVLLATDIAGGITVSVHSVDGGTAAY